MTTPYMTPDRFRQQALGVDLEGLDDVELQTLLMSASATVDRYCAAPQSYSFRGGLITDEVYAWDPGYSAYVSAQRRFYLRATPVKAVSALSIYLSNDDYVAFTSPDYFVTPYSVEVINFTPYSIVGAMVVPGFGLPRPMARISYTYGYEFTSTDEWLQPTDAWTFTAQNQFWDDSDVTVTVDGATTTTGFTLDREEGAVIFDSAQTGEVRATYGYSLPFEIARATALTAAEDLNERDLVAKGLGNLNSLKVGEISMSRTLQRAGTTNSATKMSLPAEAAQLLSGYVFNTVR